MLVASNFHTHPGRVQCDVFSEGHSERPFALFFENDCETAPPHDNWSFAALLPLAMVLGEDLRIDGSITAALLDRCESIQDIYQAWLPRTKRIQVIVSSTAAEPRPSHGVGVFYSGGVDSAYSLAKHQDRVNYLILCHGFDVLVTDSASFKPCKDSTAEVANRLTKRICVVRTNIRDLSNQYSKWSMYHGAAMAAAGMTLAGLLSTCIVGSSYSYAQLHPWGSHPLLDSLWSTPSQHWLHDGAEAKRVEKIRRIANEPWALSGLRVCWEDTAAYNCGKCEKCLRTMIALTALGRLADCPVLPAKLDYRLVERVHLTAGSALFWAEFEDLEMEPALRHAVEVSLNNYRCGLPPRDGSLRSELRRWRARFKRAIGALSDSGAVKKSHHG